MKPQNLGEHIKTHPGALFPLNAGCYIVWIPGRKACPKLPLMMCEAEEHEAQLPSKIYKWLL